jgi:hypothetical protein
MDTALKLESLRNLCVLCVSAVYLGSRKRNRRDAENAEVAQRRQHPLKLLVVAWFVLALFCAPKQCAAQQVVDKMVATVNAGVRTELITYSDLLWQLSLQPNTSLDNPTSAELNRALRLLIDQRLILQEAEKLPSIAPTPKEINDARDELARNFASVPEFQQRLQRVGLTTEKLDEILDQRLKMEKYLNFRFRSFVVVSQTEIADYYRDVFVPRLRARSPGQIVPTLEEAKGQIEKALTEAKIESDTDAFLDTARERAEIVMLNPI